MAEITYICKRTVVSTKPVKPGKYHPLSVIDRQMEKNHIRMVYYYRTCSGEGELGQLTKKLRETLSEMLTSFPIVTGRLVRDDENGHWKVKCNDAGVRMVEAKAKGSVEEWLRHVDREKELKLVYWEDMFHKPYFWSTFYVQLTEFEKGGLAIGLSCIHMLADTTTATMFMKAWAHISSGHKITPPPLFRPLPSRKPHNTNPSRHPYTDLINHYSSSNHKPIPVTEKNYTTISLAFSDQMVRACMAMAQAAGPPSPSPFEALACLFWLSLSKVKGKRKELVDMSICVDVRKALKLDSGFFGNCMIYNKVKAGNFGDNNLSEAARAIGEVVAKMDGDDQGIMDLIEWLEVNDVNCPTMMNGHDLICANLEGVDPYLAVFDELMKPIHVSYYVEPVLGEGQVLIFSATPGDGVLSRVAMVTIAEDEATRLCQDDLLLSFSPTILMKSG